MSKNKKPREIWCLSNFNVTTQMPDGQVQPLSEANNEQIAETAVNQADALIKELNK